MSKNLTIGGIVVALILSLSSLMFGGTNTVETIREIAVGTSVGPDHYNRQFFQAGFQSGGTAMATSSTAATYTLLSGEIDQDVSYISWNANVSTTLTSMASTSMYFLGENVGDKRVYDIYNASTTAASTITFAAGTGVDLQEDEGETVVVNGLESARLTFIRKADSDVSMILEVFQVGD